MPGPAGLKNWLRGPSVTEEKGRRKDSPVLDRLRIAVLPFSNLSPDASDEYFADGITEELIATLSKVREVSVVSRTSVMQYRKNPKPIKDVAEDLLAGTILEGSVRKAGNRVRVTVQLVDSARDRHEWAENYDRGLEDIFAIQSDISQKVADVLRVQLLAHEKKGLNHVPTSSVDAYTEFLKGRQRLGDRTEQGFDDAIHYFEKAIRLDPLFARAYSGLADAYFLLENWAVMSPQEAYPKAMGFVTKALELDDGLAEARTSLAYALGYAKHDWVEAEREFQRAIELNPSYSTAHLWYGFGVLHLQGRWDEALREMEQASRLDPFSIIIMINRARLLLWTGRREAALDQFRLAARLFPEHRLTHSELGATLVSMSKIDEGMSEIEKARKLAPDTLVTKVRLAYAYVASGRRSDAEIILAELRERSTRRYVPGTFVAMVYAVLGDKDQAFEWLNRAAQDGVSSIVMLNDPMFDAIRSDTRFHKLLETLGLSHR